MHAERLGDGRGWVRGAQKSLSSDTAIVLAMLSTTRDEYKGFVNANEECEDRIVGRVFRTLRSWCSVDLECSRRV